MRMTAKQRKVLEFCDEMPHTAQEILDMFGVKNQGHNGVTGTSVSLNFGQRYKEIWKNESFCIYLQHQNKMEGI